MKKLLPLILIGILAVSSCSRYASSNIHYIISDAEYTYPIYLQKDADSLLLWAAHELASDMESLTGRKPVVKLLEKKTKEPGIWIGEFHSSLLPLSGKSRRQLEGKWEHFFIAPRAEGIVVAGSDVRGTVYGVFELAKRMGISPWKWWADVHPLPKKELSLPLPKAGLIHGPSVKYRGIFINDEDWGLQPWAAKTFEPETGDIGPKTYEKVFQLLLRLKGNTLWPAMHPCTKAFYKIPGNNEMAIKYHIVVGTSHCEPMLRNNVDEWDHDSYGDYNFFTNSEMVCEYWQDRINDVSGAENIITLGMRGVHDGKMQGAKNREEQRSMTEEIIKIQREMIAATKHKSLDSIAQTIVLYKEVLDLYNMGLEIPEDVTLMWCDDNYGYIRRLSNEEEQQRSGGSGVYYHLSYWGRPHDYLWLSSTQPGLIWYEMSRAYANGAREMWIANVGDIKPAEYNMEFFLDLAWDINSIDEINISKHMTNWAAREFGKEQAGEIAEIMDEYYRLAFLRRPEFMGWSQTEPTTEVYFTAFNQYTIHNELEGRINAYKNLEERVLAAKSSIPEERLAAYYQLVEYPVRGAAQMNYKFLFAKLAAEEEDAFLREKYQEKVKSAYGEIEALTTYYNDSLSSAKWKRMMSMSPRNLPVFHYPEKLLESKLESRPKQEALLKQPLYFFDAHDYSMSRSPQGISWKIINGLGYSNNAVTLMPLENQLFDTASLPYLEYRFNVKKTGPFEIQLRFLPTHSNNYDQKVGVQVDDGEIRYFSLNTKGRSQEWKTNVLRNSQVIETRYEAEQIGLKHVKIYVNQTGIVLDQLAIDFNGQEEFYEIKLND